MSLHDISATTLSGDEQSLADYKDKVVLVVNVASECGSTPQYAGAGSALARVQGQGAGRARLSVERLRRPGAGERGADPRVLHQELRRDVPDVREDEDGGDGQSPVFRYLSAEHGEPKWNFHKYLVSKKGRVIKAFPTSMAPDDPKLRAAIEAALEEPTAQG